MLLATGCGAPLPADESSAAIAQSVGVAEAIRFETQGGPTDVDEQDPSVLTRADAVQRAVHSEPRIQAALAQVRTALADARQARLLPNPLLNFILRFPEGGGDPIIEAGLSAELVSLLQRPRRISAADHRLLAASSAAVTAALDTVLEVQERYAAVQGFDAQVVVLEERRRLIGRLLESAQSRLRVGEGTRLDVLTLDAQRVEIETEIAERESERRDARLALSRLLGQPSGPAAWQVSPWKPVQRLGIPEGAWIGLALEHRPEIQAGRWELAALGDDAALSRLAALDGAEVGIEAERDGDWSVGPGVSLPLPIFDWGQARSAKALAEAIQARHKLTQARRQAVEDVRRALASLAGAQAALDRVSLQLIPLQQQRQEQAQAAYRNGLADITAVLLAEQDSQAARAKQIELQQKASAAMFKLERAVGGPGVAARVASAPSTQPTTRPHSNTESP
jgi:outer membrane protein TolC